MNHSDLLNQDEYAEDDNQSQSSKVQLREEEKKEEQKVRSIKDLIAMKNGKITMSQSGLSQSQQSYQNRLSKATGDQRIPYYRQGEYIAAMNEQVATLSSFLLSGTFQLMRFNTLNQISFQLGEATKKIKSNSDLISHTLFKIYDTYQVTTHLHSDLARLTSMNFLQQKNFLLGTQQLYKQYCECQSNSSEVSQFAQNMAIMREQGTADKRSGVDVVQNDIIHDGTLVYYYQKVAIALCNQATLDAYSNIFAKFFEALGQDQVDDVPISRNVDSFISAFADYQELFAQNKAHTVVNFDKASPNILYVNFFNEKNAFVAVMPILFGIVIDMQIYEYQQIQEFQMKNKNGENLEGVEQFHVQLQKINGKFQPSSVMKDNFEQQIRSYLKANSIYAEDIIEDDYLDTIAYGKVFNHYIDGANTHLFPKKFSSLFAEKIFFRGFSVLEQEEKDQRNNFVKKYAPIAYYKTTDLVANQMGIYENTGNGKIFSGVTGQTQYEKEKEKYALQVEAAKQVQDQQQQQQQQDSAQFIVPQQQQQSTSVVGQKRTFNQSANVSNYIPVPKAGGNNSGYKRQATSGNKFSFKK